MCVLPSPVAPRGREFDISDLMPSFRALSFDFPGFMEVPWLRETFSSDPACGLMSILGVA